MIAIELVRVVADEPIVPTTSHGRVRSEPKALAVDEWGVLGIVYLPGLALVVVTYADTSSCIVPVEHVWHMTPKPGADVIGPLLETLR